MASSIERAEADVQRVLKQAAVVAEREGVTLAEAEAELWTVLLALGRAYIALFLARTAGRKRPETYEHDGVRYALDTTTRRNSQIGTRFGKISFSRAVGRGLIGRRRADLPVDRELGLCSGFSLGTVTALVQLCTLLAFGTARRVFAESHEWAPSSRATLRMVDAVGAEARGFLDEASVPDDDGEELFIQVDGRGAPMISTTEAQRRRKPKQRPSGTKRHGRRQRRRKHLRKRRRKGDKSKNAKVAFVGVIYTLRKTEDGFEGPINKRLIATFESHQALFRWLYEHAVARGYGKKRCRFLADGSDHIWRLQQQYFPKAVPCIDWYHIVEKLWTAGTARAARSLRRGSTNRSTASAAASSPNCRPS
ncbi:MAG TPA: hypothetical protein VJN18_06380 [Polyangiaceae bacterium]|nr:hypothetical protein [Polyangiaceae bacterium]